MLTPELDPRLYGLAPKEADAHDGQVLWTMAGVMKYLGITSDTTLRRIPALMQMRRVIAPRVYRWIPDEVRAWAAALPKGPTPLAVTKALRPSRTAAKKKRQMRRAREGWEREYDQKLGWVKPKGAK